MEGREKEGRKKEEEREGWRERGERVDEREGERERGKKRGGREKGASAYGTDTNIYRQDYVWILDAHIHRDHRAYVQ